MSPAKIEVVEVPTPTIGPGEVLVRTTLASVCGSDLHRVFHSPPEAPYPAPAGAPGHEGIGRVVQSDTDRFSEGQLVLTVPSPEAALGFAEYQALAPEFLVPLPEGSDEVSMLMAQQLGTVVFAMKRFLPDGVGGGSALVVGAGSAGLYFLQLLKRAGFSQAIVADMVPERLAMAKRLGADVTVRVPEGSPSEVALEVTGGKGVEMSIDAAGSDASRREAMLAVARRGRIGLFGLPEGREDGPFPFARIFGRQPTIEMAGGAQREPGLSSFREAISLIGDGEIEAKSLVTHTMPLEEVGSAMQLCSRREQGVIKMSLTL